MTEFPTIMGAVKRSAQTDRFKILAAMYVLGARRNAVGVGQITDLLKLHLGSRMPANTSSALRKFGAAVDIEKGPPLKWRLTTPGLEWLRAESNLPLPTEDAAEYG